MSLTTSSNGFSSSLGVSGFFSSAFAAGLSRAADVSRSPPFSAAMLAGRAAHAASNRANVLSVVGWFIALRKVEDLLSVFPIHGSSCLKREAATQAIMPGKLRHDSLLALRCPQLWPLNWRSAVAWRGVQDSNHQERMNLSGPFWTWLMRALFPTLKRWAYCRLVSPGRAPDRLSRWPRPPRAKI